MTPYRDAFRNSKPEVEIQGNQRKEALEQLEKTYSKHQVEEDHVKFQKLLVEAQNHLSFFKMVSRRRLTNDGKSGPTYFVYKNGKVLNGADAAAAAGGGGVTVPTSQIMDKSQVTAEHHRKHTDLLKRQYFINRK